MITRAQFQIQIDRLVDTFDDRYFSDQRVHMMWQAADGHEYHTVIGVVDSFIRSSKQAPLPADFSAAFAEISRNSGHRKYSLGEIQPEEICKCFDCGDSGFVRVIRKPQFEEWAKWNAGSAPCHCDRGEKLIEAAKRQKSPTDLGGQFSEHWMQSYSVMPAHGHPQGIAENPEGAA